MYLSLHDLQQTEPSFTALNYRLHIVARTVYMLKI